MLNSSYITFLDEDVVLMSLAYHFSEEDKLT